MHRTFSEHSGISSLPSVSDRFVATSYPPQLPPTLPPSQNIYSPAKVSTFESELYDNDPINLAELNYSRYSSNVACTKCRPPSMVSSHKKPKKSAFKSISSPSSTSAATPSLSANSTQTFDDSTSMSFPSSPKVKFNEFQIHHHYN